ncbi:MAG: hypothetical protein ACO1Q7_16955 [Gemmatimonas sp.]
MTNTQLSSSRVLARVSAGTTAFLAATLLMPSSLAAQSANTDARWQPFLGCWVSNQSSTTIGADAVSGSMVCVVPVSGSASVDLATIVNRRVTSRERITVNGQREAKSADDCPGFETASWSGDGSRIYIRSEYACNNNLNVKGSGVFAMSEGGEFVQVIGTSVGSNAGARVVKFRQADVALAPGSIISDSSVVTTVPAQTPFSQQAARTAAGKKTDANLIIDINKNTSEQIAQAWLGEFGGEMKLNGQELIALADAGLPGSVTDMMVALSNPTRFQITARGPENAPQTVANNRNNAGAMDPRCSFDYFDLGWSSMSRYCMARYGMGWGFGFGSPWRYGMMGGPWGYNQLGIGNYWGNGYYYGNNPIIIVPRDPVGGGSGSVPGRAVKGGGYTSGSGGSSSGASSPRTSSGASSSGGGASSGGAASSSGGGDGGSSGGRTAKPRPPM